MKTYLFIFLLTLAAFQGKSQEKEIANQLSKQLKASQMPSGLYYPASVKRFYTKNNFQPAWIKPQSGMGKTWQAMLMLDCVLQFGLAHADYHPYELSYDSLHVMLEKPDQLSAEDKARFDIVLTDAMITLMNHLHYGKFNPDYVVDRVDQGNGIPFIAEQKLRAALLENDLLAAILDVQPKNKAYQDLQLYMHLVKGQYTGDCYEVPEADVRLAAINMERLRWADFGDTPYLHVNIPSYTLKLHEVDSVYDFKIIVGKPEHPTPTLRSAIGYFTTAPDWKVPQELFVKDILPKTMKRIGFLEDNHYAVYNKSGAIVAINNTNLQKINRNPGEYSLRQSSGCDAALGAVVFRFPNDFDIYLHDSPDQKLFKQEVRSVSHGCVGVENATSLAALLLRYDGAAGKIPLMQKNADSYLRSNFMLSKPLPIKVTYITCGYKDGILKRYKDIYNLDDRLEHKLYNIDQQLALK